MNPTRRVILSGTEASRNAYTKSNQPDKGIKPTQDKIKYDKYTINTNHNLHINKVLSSLAEIGLSFLTNNPAMTREVSNIIAERLEQIGDIDSKEFKEVDELHSKFLEEVAHNNVSEATRKSIKRVFNNVIANRKEEIITSPEYLEDRVEMLENELLSINQSLANPNNVNKDVDKKEKQDIEENLVDALKALTDSRKLKIFNAKRDGVDSGIDISKLEAENLESLKRLSVIKESVAKSAEKERNREYLDLIIHNTDRDLSELEGNESELINQIKLNQGNDGILPKLDATPFETAQLEKDLKKDLVAQKKILSKVINNWNKYTENTELTEKQQAKLDEKLKIYEDKLVAVSNKIEMRKATHDLELLNKAMNLELEKLEGEYSVLLTPEKIKTLNEKVGKLKEAYDEQTKPLLEILNRVDPKNEYIEKTKLCSASLEMLRLNTTGDVKLGCILIKIAKLSASAGYTVGEGTVNLFKNAQKLLRENALLITVVVLLLGLAYNAMQHKSDDTISQSGVALRELDKMAKKGIDRIEFIEILNDELIKLNSTNTIPMDAKANKKILAFVDENHKLSDRLARVKEAQRDSQAGRYDSGAQLANEIVEDKNDIKKAMRLMTAMGYIGRKINPNLSYKSQQLIEISEKKDEMDPNKIENEQIVKNLKSMILKMAEESMPINDMYASSAAIKVEVESIAESVNKSFDENKKMIGDLDSKIDQFKKDDEIATKKKLENLSIFSWDYLLGVGESIESKALKNAVDRFEKVREERRLIQARRKI